MIAVDTNLLVYAHRTETEPHHAAAARLADLAEGAAPWALPIFCITEPGRSDTRGRGEAT